MDKESIIALGLSAALLYWLYSTQKQQAQQAAGDVSADRMGDNARAGVSNHDTLEAFIRGE